MNFKLECIQSMFTSDEANRYKTLGFTFRECSSPIVDGVYNGVEEPPYLLKIKDDTLTLSLSTLEELRKFQEEWGDLILTEDTLKIYDQWEV